MITLTGVAERLEAWANQSEQERWSTHLVKPMRQLAGKIYEQAWRESFVEARSRQAGRAARDQIGNSRKTIEETAEYVEWQSVDGQLPAFERRLLSNQAVILQSLAVLLAREGGGP